ncbi:AcrR family transcriptional regulator [Actinoplanes octamycinicus]|uniref:AcrR family transcriptional regulator n=1 Tax=Actinoplanes octamycinicus TaxID=135948 RepID=A0A7W7H4S7_9ACTN|nr:TetR/AcrR family transcriptional regulator [Actinoplanes octamycinicus]MBB4743949.1 AcrR family transcriptional regulator [Actinoplanes octamycinicus]GIE58573.1 TetR family transcriptional regulator [Actinoplanes octamycinicus]
MTGHQEPVIWLRRERAAGGRPAERSRAEITAAAVRLADQEGLEAVSMRRVAGLLGTGAASLYRYVATRDDLLDLMIDSTATEYQLVAPSGDWQTDLLALARQARDIMRRHRWLPALVIGRPALGPHGTDLLEHVLEILDDHPAEPARKLEAFALLSGVTALFVQSETAATSAARHSAYLRHAAASGHHPHIAALVAATPSKPQPSEPFATVLAGALAGVLGSPTDHV